MNYSVGTRGYTDISFTKGGFLFIRNKYVLRLFGEITGLGQTADGQDAYQVHCYDARVEINGNWASINELNTLGEARDMAQKYIDRVLGKTVYFPKNEFRRI